MLLSNKAFPISSSKTTTITILQHQNRYELITHTNAHAHNLRIHTTAAATTTTPAASTTTAAMEYRKLGRTGLDVSILSFGSWVSFDYQLGVPEAKAIIKEAFDHGVNFFDNAEVYAHGASEEIMGEALKQLCIPRTDIVISSKVYFGASKAPKPTAKGLSRKHIVEGVRQSLARLQLEYLDVVFAHRPDPTTPVEETVRAFNYVIDQGLAFYWGTSEWPASAIEEAHSVAERLGLIPPCAEQPQYSIVHRKRVEIEYDSLYQRYGTGLTTFSPLACGLLTGKYNTMYNTHGTAAQVPPTGSRFSVERYKFLADRWLTEDKVKRAQALQPIAQELGCTPAQLALAWCAANPHVSTVLTGATSVEQVQENIKAVEVVRKLTPEVMKRIDDAVLLVSSLAGGNTATGAMQITNAKELELGKN